MSLLAISGLIGNLCFGGGCLSLAYHTRKAGHGKDTRWSTALLFETANITFYTYLIGTYGLDPLYSFLGGVEIASWLIVIAYKVHDMLEVPDIFAQVCTRPAHIEGPCSGLPRRDCPGYQAWIDSKRMFE